MSDSNRWLLFLLGLLLGLLGGAGFFIFKIDSMMEKINPFSSSRDTAVIQQAKTEEIKERADASTGLSTGIKKNTGKKDSFKNNMSSAELLAQKYSREVPIKRVMAEADSLLREGTPSEKDSSEMTQEQNTAENFIIRKDELIGSGNFRVLNLPIKDNHSSDSLLEKISGINHTKHGSLLKVEFWQSPINYKGYKISKNKAVLFGINPDEKIKFFHFNENVYMQYGQDYYLLIFTDAFRQFEKITDAAITGTLK